QRGRHGLAFQRAEGGLAVGDEDLRHRLAGALLDVGVGVAEGHAEPLGEQLSDARLPRAGRSDEHHARRSISHYSTFLFTLSSVLGSHAHSPWTHSPYRTRRCSWYPARLRATSATESPPNFSTAASASTRATIASATTPAAGTAQTSLRWWFAVAASPVATSTVRS